jgi:hypothetical protein
MLVCEVCNQEINDPAADDVARFSEPTDVSDMGGATKKEIAGGSVYLVHGRCVGSFPSRKYKRVK